MKISSEIIRQNVYSTESKLVFVMYLDTQRTGNQAADTFNCAYDFDKINMSENVNEISDFLIPILSQLIIDAYDDPDNYDSPTKKKPLESIKETNFDPTCLNGMRGCKLK